MLSTESRNLSIAALFAVQRIQNATADQQSCQRKLWEVILASQIIKTDNAIDSDAIHEHNDRGQHLDAQLVHEEWTPLRIHPHEPGLFVLSANVVQVHVDDLAPLEVLVEKGDHNVLGLRHERQELSLDDLCVRAVAQSSVRLLLFVFGLHSLDALFAHRPHNPL